jgi:hypothetical protein
MPARKKEIPKDGGSKVRVLSIPAILDCVVQGALKLILEPIFEADFQAGSCGYRPKRTAQEAVAPVAHAIVEEKTRIIDLDLAAPLVCGPAAVWGSLLGLFFVQLCSCESGSSASHIFALTSGMSIL